MYNNNATLSHFTTMFLQCARITTRRCNFYNTWQLYIYNFTHFTKTYNLQTHTLQLCNFTYATLQLCNFTYATLQNVQLCKSAHNLQMQLYKTTYKNAQLTKNAQLYKKRATLQMQLCKCNFTHVTTFYKTRNFTNATLQLCNFTYATLQNAQLYKCNFTRFTNVQGFTKRATLHLCKFTTLQFYICNFTHFTKRATFYKRAILQMQLCKCNFTHVTTFYKTRIFTNTTLQLCKKRALYKRATLRLMCKHFARTILQLYIRYKNVQRFTTMFLQCVRITTRLCQVLMCLQH